MQSDLPFTNQRYIKNYTETYRWCMYIITGKHLNWSHDLKFVIFASISDITHRRQQSTRVWNTHPKSWRSLTHTLRWRAAYLSCEYLLYTGLWQWRRNPECSPNPERVKSRGCLSRVSQTRTPFIGQGTKQGRTSFQSI